MTTAIPERWTELVNSRKQKQLCSEQVKQIKDACSEKCGKQHIIECPECFEKAIEKMHARYRDGTDREWFTQRRAFRQELDDLLGDVKKRKVTLEHVESRMDQEKEAWYRWTLRRHPDFLAVAEDGTRQQNLRDMLDDPDTSRDELVKTIWGGVGIPADWAAKVDEFVNKVSQLDNDGRKQLYRQEFFQDDKGETVPHAQPYLDSYGTASLEDTVDKLVKDIQRARNLKPQRDHHQGRLNELKRAKTAFERNRQQAKSQAAGTAQGIQVGDESRPLPPCLVCQSVVDPQQVTSCTVCQAVVQMGGEATLTTYCSASCYEKGHDDHVAKEHDCEGGDDCAQLSDEDVDMNTPESVACRQCLEAKALKLFCTEKCAGKNMEKHYTSHHEGEIPEGEITSLALAMSQAVEPVLKEKNPGVEFKTV